MKSLLANDKGIPNCVMMAKSLRQVAARGPQNIGLKAAPAKRLPMAGIGQWHNDLIIQTGYERRRSCAHCAYVWTTPIYSNKQIDEIR